MTFITPALAPRLARLGPVMQLAFVPQEPERALDFWTRTMGVGPFFRFDGLVLNDALYKKLPTDIRFSFLIGYWNDMQIEIIIQHNDAPSIYRSWREFGMEGLHHTCVLTDDMAAGRAACACVGAEIVQEATVPGGVEVFYADTGGGPGTMLEVLKPSVDLLGLFAMMRAAARDWDGSDPVRLVG